MSLDVLPVKGPQGSPLLSQAVCPPQDKSSSQEMWAVQPEHLILIAPSACEYSNNTTAVHSGSQVTLSPLSSRKYTLSIYECDQWLT